MSVAMTLTAKGQFTFNKTLMEHLGIRAGEKVLVKKQPDGSLKLESAKKQIDILSLAGTLKTDIKLTDDELQTIIQQSYVKSGQRGLT
jgi:bifunctional DNA-binding transcriptional regulator/antitoxin component of YhaV-PrlF toxin-antitoxin module